MIKIIASALTVMTGAALFGASAAADTQIKAVFIEGAPKDQFRFTNIGGCDLGPLTLTLDLSTSEAGLVFDVTGAGAGVEVFQPLEILSGSNLINTVSAVADGDTTVIFELSAFPALETVSFSVDVDDTVRDSALGQIRISDSEIRGAFVSVLGQTAYFQDQPLAITEAVSCPTP